MMSSISDRDLFPTNRIISPSLGSPVFINNSSEEFKTSVIINTSQDQSEIVNEVFYLQEVGKKAHKIILETISIKEQDHYFDSPLDSIIKRRTELKVLEVSLKLECDTIFNSGDNRPYKLFNLGHKILSGGKHAVVFRINDFAHYRLIYVSDIHVAEAWNKIEEKICSIPNSSESSNLAVDDQVERIFSQNAFLDNFLNPNKSFAEFISYANQKSNNNELDFIILGGDLVDYVYKCFRKEVDKSYQGTNFYFFEQFILGEIDGVEELHVPIITQTGNHDYRLYPYRFESYGLKHCGLHDLQAKYLLGLSKRPHLSIPSLVDIDSVLTRSGKEHSLKYYFAHINPYSNYSIEIGGIRYIFLDTGRDIFMALHLIKASRWGNLIKLFKSGIEDPDSEGFNDNQINFLKREIGIAEEKTIIFAHHAPIFNPKSTFSNHPINNVSNDTSKDTHNVITKERVLFNVEEFLKSEETTNGNIQFESDLIIRRLKEGCIFQNQLSLIRIVSNHKDGWLSLSGHTHRGSEIKLTSNPAQVIQGNFSHNSYSETSNIPQKLFLASQGLGHTQSRYEPPGSPSFYEVEISQGNIKNILLQSLPSSSGTIFVEQFFCNETHEFQITFWNIVNENNQNMERGELIINAWILSPSMNRPMTHPPLEIISKNSPDILTEFVERVEDKKAERYFGKNVEVFLHRFMCKLSDKFLLQTKKAKHSMNEIEVFITAELKTKNNKKNSDYKILWFPRSFII